MDKAFLSFSVWERIWHISFFLWAQETKELKKATWREHSHISRCTRTLTSESWRPPWWCSSTFPEAARFLTCFSALLIMDYVQSISWQNNLSELKNKNMKHHLGLKKGKTRRIKINAKFSFFLPLSLIYSLISTPWLPRIPLLPQIRDGKKCWCSVLYEGKGEMQGNTLQRSSPGMAHWRAWGDEECREQTMRTVDSWWP